MRSVTAPGGNGGGYGHTAGSGGRVWRADPAGRKSLRRTGVAAAASDDEQQIRRVSVTPEPPQPTPDAGPARLRAPPAPRAAALAPGGRDAMSHGATHSPVPAAGARPGPEGMRDRGMWAVGWRRSRTGESRAASWPRLSLAFSGPSQGMGRAERDLWGAGCWRGVCSPEALPLLCWGAWGAGWERVSRVTVTGLHVGPLNRRES